MSASSRCRARDTGEVKTRSPRPRLVNALAVALAGLSVVGSVGCDVPSPAAPQRAKALPAAGPALGQQVRYGPESWQTARVYRRRVGTVQLGTIVFFGAGGFMSVDTRDAFKDRILARERARGYDVVSVSYRTTGRTSAQVVKGPPAVPVFDQVLNDAHLAIRWVRTSGAEFGVRTTNVIAMGYSAGGAIAGLIGTAWNDNPLHTGRLSRPDKWVSFAGVLDCHDGLGVLSPVWCQELAGYPSRRGSISTYVDADDPPGWIAHSPDDPYVDVASSFRADVAARNERARIEFDLTDSDASGRPMACGHAPQSCINAAAFDTFLGSTNAALDVGPPADDQPDKAVRSGR